jgi:hypothetical protein
VAAADKQAAHGAGGAEPQPRLDLAAQSRPVADEAAGVDGDDAGGDTSDRQTEGEHNGGAADDQGGGADADGVWACWKQSRGLPLRTWERRVTLAHLLALALVLGLAMAAGDWGA